MIKSLLALAAGGAGVLLGWHGSTNIATPGDPVAVAPRNNHKPIPGNAQVHAVPCHAGHAAKMAMPSHPGPVAIGAGEPRAGAAVADNQRKAEAVTRDNARWMAASALTSGKVGKTTMDCIPAESKAPAK